MMRSQRKAIDPRSTEAMISRLTSRTYGRRSTRRPRFLSFGTAVATLCAACSGWLIAAIAHAAPDPYGLGDGHWGALVLSADLELNEPVAFTSDVLAGDDTVSVSDSEAFDIGDLMLLWQPVGISPAPAPGTPGSAIDISGAPA